MLDRLKDMLKRHEGVRLKPYLCPAGYRTIGVGWNLDAHKPPEDIAAYLRLHGEITEDMSDRLLHISAVATVSQCHGIYDGYHDFTEARKIALADFVFNLGARGAVKFRRMLAAITDGDWWKAADEMQDSAWFGQVGDRGREIVAIIRMGEMP